MTVYFLVLITATGMTTIPEPYKTEEVCKQAGRAFVENRYAGRSFYCAPWSEDTKQ
jgi:hypothetical protein